MNQLGNQEHNIFVLWPGYHTAVKQMKTEQFSSIHKETEPP